MAFYWEGGKNLKRPGLELRGFSIKKERREGGFTPEYLGNKYLIEGRIRKNPIMRLHSHFKW